MTDRQSRPDDRDRGSRVPAIAVVVIAVIALILMIAWPRENNDGPSDHATAELTHDAPPPPDSLTHRAHNLRET